MGGRAQMPSLPHWYSAFLMLWTFNPFHVVMTPTIKLSLLLHNCNFSTIVNCNVNTWYTGYLICKSPKWLWPTGRKPLFSWQAISSWWQLREESPFCLGMCPLIGCSNPSRRPHTHVPMNNTNWRQIKWHIFNRREKGKEKQKMENVKLEDKSVGSA